MVTVAGLATNCRFLCFEILAFAIPNTLDQVVITDILIFLQDCYDGSDESKEECGLADPCAAKLR
jgi:hypothetical protein